MFPKNETLFYQDIADNAQAALDCLGVQVWRYDVLKDEIMVAAWAGLQLAPSRRALQMIQRFFPKFLPLEYKNSANLNPFLRSVYHDGKLQTTTFTKAAENVAPLLAIGIASLLAGMRFTLTAPIKIDGRVAAGISFIQKNRFSAQNIRTCEAFAQQASLLLENARLTQHLALQLEQLERSKHLITENEERVRRDISELLHTRVQTKLLIAWHRLGSYTELEDEHKKTMLIEQVQAELEQIREQDVREASHMLHPAVIRLGLIPAVRSLAARVSKVVEVRVEADNTLDGVQLNEPLKLVAYRIIEEALSNTLRHANAKNAIIRIGVQKNNLEIEIKDDGQGFDNTNLKTGLGLSSLAARVHSASGKWTIESQITYGTTLNAQLPLLETQNT